MTSISFLPVVGSAPVGGLSSPATSSSSKAKPSRSLTSEWTPLLTHKRVSISTRGAAGRRSSREATLLTSALGLALFPTHVGLRQNEMGEKMFAGKLQHLRRKVHATAPPCSARGEKQVNQAEFTDMTWQAIIASVDVAKESKQIVETEHLLKALLEQRNGLARRIFAKIGVDNTSLLQAIDRFIQRQPKVTGDTSGSVLGRHLEALLDRARGHKKDRGDSFVSVEHLVLSFASDTRFGEQLFKGFESTPASLNAATDAIRGPQKVTDQDAEQKYEAVEKYGMNSTEMARQDPVIGCDDEIRRCIQVLSQRTKNNPVLIGEPGVGKTAISAVAQSSGQALTEIPEVEVKTTPDNAAAWKEFVERVSGEWDGYGADFNFLGEPCELPSQVVPDTFRDWGLEIHDWQTMCPTLGQEEPKSLGYKVIRLLPTVGCEADAATPYCLEEKDFGTALNYAFHPSGSYTAVWPGPRVVKNSPEPGRTGKIVIRNTENSKNEWEVEHCLVDEGGSTRNRARVLQQFKVDEGTKSPQLKSITVYMEQWDGPFRNGESLGGCSTSGSGFATTPSLQPGTLAGNWHVDSFFAELEEAYSSPKQLASRGSRDVERLQMTEVVSLPKNLWSSVKASEEANSFVIEAGWLVNPDHCIVSSLEFLPSGDFQASNIRFEQRR